MAPTSRGTDQEVTMKKNLALLVASLVLVASGAAYAGEPTGRFQGAAGTTPQGAEQVYFDNGGGTNYTAAKAGDIPWANGAATNAVEQHVLGRTLVISGDQPESDVQPA
jgi:hypothetical protein